MKMRDHLPFSVLVAASVFVTTPAMAEVFVAPYGGYSFGASEFTISADNTNDQGSLKISESDHYGFMAGVTTKDPGNIYFLYSHQGTELRSGGNFSPNIITDLNVDYFHLGGSLFFPNGNFKPYVTASLGLTQMRPGDNYSTESRFSMGFGAGIEYQMTDAFSLFADARGYATFVNSSSALFCDGGNCLWSISSDIMWQGQANLGVKLKF
ncbi:porin family protein [Shewanella canadensis]|uniref:Porin family protein n=1 Tax=Shewanella canadensis TaxID=271096 RepID=A0A3S0KDH0_9GAMM|nr:outer membrane beta-barrel protein [Shewanella canadensis]RTR40872.1 porin family protein [Shewanella canadensis]